MVATGITADTPIGTPLVAWLVGLSLASLLTSLVSLVTLDGATWLDTKVTLVCGRQLSCGCSSFGSPTRTELVALRAQWQTFDTAASRKNHVCLSDHRSVLDSRLTSASL